MLPVVSVLMATYNDHPDRLWAALDSIVRQTCSDWELIVIDDSTNGGTIEVLEEYAGKLPGQMVLVHNQVRRGFVASLNQGLALARGHFIARMDGDDISEPHRLETQVKFMESHPEIGIVGSHVLVIDENGAPQSIRKYRCSHEEICARGYFRNPMAHPSVMLRRATFDLIGNYEFAHSEDYELWLRAIKRSVRLSNIDEPLLRYRVVPAESHKRNRSGGSKYVMRAKIRHFNWKYPVRSLLGICLSAIQWLMPQPMIDALHARDAQKQIL